MQRGSTDGGVGLLEADGVLDKDVVLLNANVELRQRGAIQKRPGHGDVASPYRARDGADGHEAGLEGVAVLEEESVPGQTSSSANVLLEAGKRGRRRHVVPRVVGDELVHGCLELGALEEEGREWQLVLLHTGLRSNGDEERDVVADAPVEEGRGVAQDLGLREHGGELRGDSREVDAVDARGEGAFVREVRVQRVDDLHSFAKCALPSLLVGPLVDHREGVLLRQVGGSERARDLARDEVVEVTSNHHQPVARIPGSSRELLVHVAEGDGSANGAELKVVNVVVDEEGVLVADDQLEDAAWHEFKLVDLKQGGPGVDVLDACHDTPFDVRVREGGEDQRTVLELVGVSRPSPVRSMYLLECSDGGRVHEGEGKLDLLVLEVGLRMEQGAGVPGDEGRLR